MNFFNLGSGEFVFLIVLAILLLGPRRAVEWAQQFSRFAARISQEWSAVQRDVLQEFQTVQAETIGALESAAQEVIREGQGLRKEGAEAVRSFQETAQGIRDFQKQFVAPPFSLPQEGERTGDSAGLAG